MGSPSRIESSAPFTPLERSKKEKVFECLITFLESAPLLLGVIAYVGWNKFFSIESNRVMAAELGLINLAGITKFFWRMCLSGKEEPSEKKGIATALNIDSVKIATKLDADSNLSTRKPDNAQPQPGCAKVKKTALRFFEIPDTRTFLSEDYNFIAIKSVRSDTYEIYSAESMIAKNGNLLVRKKPSYNAPSVDNNLDDYFDSDLDDYSIHTWKHSIPAQLLVSGDLQFIRFEQCDKPNRVKLPKE